MLTRIARSSTDGMNRAEVGPMSRFAHAARVEMPQRRAP
jgi:hypothetical protein